MFFSFQSFFSALRICPASKARLVARLSPGSWFLTSLIHVFYAEQNQLHPCTEGGEPKCPQTDLWVCFIEFLSLCGLISTFWYPGHLLLALWLEKWGLVTLNACVRTKDEWTKRRVQTFHPLGLQLHQVDRNIPSLSVVAPEAAVTGHSHLPHKIEWGCEKTERRRKSGEFSYSLFELEIPFLGLLRHHKGASPVAFCALSCVCCQV